MMTIKDGGQTKEIIIIVFKDFDIHGLDLQKSNSEEIFYEESIHIDLSYHRSSLVKAIYVGLSDARASDDVKISYDFYRGGWVIQQASVFSWELNDEKCDRDWQEVAFIQA